MTLEFQPFEYIFGANTEYPETVLACSHADIKFNSIYARMSFSVDINFKQTIHMSDYH